MSRPLPRYLEAHIVSDPLEIALAQRQAREDHARELVAAGRTPDADPQDLRGIPAIGRNVQGVIGGTDPFAETAHREYVSNLRRQRELPSERVASVSAANG